MSLGVREDVLDSCFVDKTAEALALRGCVGRLFDNE